MFRAVFSVFVMWMVMSATGLGQAKQREEQGISPSLLAKQMGMRNSERQDKLVSDTNKLLALVANFNQQANKGSVELSSVDMAKRAEEIEKLARSVKERMLRE